jgi:hypothetical protein
MKPFIVRLGTLAATGTLAGLLAVAGSSAASAIPTRCPSTMSPATRCRNTDPQAETAFALVLTVSRAAIEDQEV